jgi:serine/threonine protein kinase/Tol biopolymer transport system component
MTGTTVLHYAILEKLGEGGMGVVYKAHDTKLDRDVALKFLPTRLAASTQDKARFIQEAKAASALNHPNVCTIHDIQEHDGQLFIVMEFVDGQTLRARLGSLSQKQAIDIGIQVADGLAAAHEKGIVHRDIKPENIMLRKDGICQIMDFGLAKLRDAGSAVNRLTKEGSTVGTAGYMSPEQVQGLDADHRSDLFSLGVVLFESLTGQLPFKGVHETALAYEIVNVDAPPPSSVRPEIDVSLDAVVLECLEKDPNERAQSAKQVSIDLKRFRRESSRTRASRVTAARPAIRVDQGGASSGAAQVPAPTWTRFLWPVVAGVAVAALAIVLWTARTAPVPVRSTLRSTITLPENLVVSTANYTPFAIASDASFIVYKANARFYYRSLDSFDSSPIAGTEEATGPFLSPDGKWLGYFLNGKLWKMPVRGGAPQELGAAVENRGGTWNAHGDIVYCPSPTLGLYLVHEGGGEIVTLTVPDSAKRERTHRWPSFLPDGRHVLFTMNSMDSPDYYGDAIIEAVDIETKERTVLFRGGASPSYIEPGFIVFWRSSALFAVPFDIATMKVTGTPFPVLENVNGDPTTGMAGYTLTAAGTLAYLPGNAGVSSSQLVKVDLHGTRTVLTAPPQSYMEPRISPDGAKIALAIQTGRDADVWVYDIPQATLTKLTFGGVNRTPAWSPDGKRIAFYSYAGGRQQLTTVAADGSGTPQLLTEGFGRMYIDDWSKDGTMMVLDVVSATRTKNPMQWGSDILTFRPGVDTNLVPFLESKFDEWESALSPDGRFIAYTSNESGTYQIYVQPFPGKEGRWIVSSEEGYEPLWSPDGTTLYYYSPGKIVAVPVKTTPSFSAGNPVTIVTGYQQKSVDSGLMYDLSPDGSWFIITQSSGDEEDLHQIRLVQGWSSEIARKAQ